MANPRRRLLVVLAALWLAATVGWFLMRAPQDRLTGVWYGEDRTDTLRIDPDGSWERFGKSPARGTWTREAVWREELDWMARNFSHGETELLCQESEIDQSDKLRRGRAERRLLACLDGCRITDTERNGLAGLTEDGLELRMDMYHFDWQRQKPWPRWLFQAASARLQGHPVPSRWPLDRGYRIHLGSTATF